MSAADNENVANVNAITGKPIVSWKDGRAYLHLTRVLYLPCGCVENIRPCPTGEGTEVITNRGMQRVVEDSKSVLAAYNAYVDALRSASEEGGAQW